MEFVFQNPSKLIFGKGKISALATEIPKGASVLFTYGGGSIKKNKVYDQVIAGLKDHKFIEFSGIEPNPTFETCRKAVEIMKNNKIDFILAVGGGSVIDGSKFISLAVEYPGDPLEILT